MRGRAGLATHSPVGLGDRAVSVPTTTGTGVCRTARAGRWGPSGSSCPVPLPGWKGT